MYYELHLGLAIIMSLFWSWIGEDLRNGLVIVVIEVLEIIKFRYYIFKVDKGHAPACNRR